MSARTRRTILYLALTGAALLGFWRVETVAENDARHNRQQNRALCVSQNEVRIGIREFLNEIVALDGEPASDFENRVIRLADERFAVIECPPATD